MQFSALVPVALDGNGPGPLRHGWNHRPYSLTCPSVILKHHHPLS
jgi:hypothetical protein